jgi:acetyl-CoA carboxylase carboxyl transferase subunit alpha
LKSDEFGVNQEKAGIRMASREVEPVRTDAMDRVQLARHERRPYAMEIIERVFTRFVELHGDRRFRDDPAIVGGWAVFEERPVMVIAHQKGRHVRERQTRNFGMPKPDGYRKALRLMHLAAKFRRPVFTLIDTPGAYPGIDAEERGQAEAIAVNLREMARLESPIIVTVTGEGGSGGALAIGVGDVVLMMENSVYSVITPEGCSAILWKDASRAPEAAARLKITAEDLLALGVIDAVVPEPPGGAHLDWDLASDYLRKAWRESLERIERMSSEELRAARYGKFRAMGRFEERL